MITHTLIFGFQVGAPNKPGQLTRPRCKARHRIDLQIVCGDPLYGVRTGDDLRWASYSEVCRLSLFAFLHLVPSVLFLRVLRVIHPSQDFQSLHCYIPNVQSLIIPIRFLPNACPATLLTSQSMDGLGCLVRQLSYESPVLVAGYE